MIKSPYPTSKYITLTGHTPDQGQINQAVENADFPASVVTNATTALSNSPDDPLSTALNFLFYQTGSMFLSAVTEEHVEKKILEKHFGLAALMIDTNPDEATRKSSQERFTFSAQAARREYLKYSLLIPMLLTIKTSVDLSQQDPDKRSKALIGTAMLASIAVKAEARFLLGAYRFNQVASGRWAILPFSDAKVKKATEEPYTPQPALPVTPPGAN